MSSPGLTAQQTAVVHLQGGAHLLTAPPGSGKTEVLVRRIIRLLAESPRDTFRILALTYTVRAAGELKERIRESVADRDQWRVNASTFHSFALDLLQNYGAPVGLKKPITVISSIEDKRILLTPSIEDSPYLAGSHGRETVTDTHWKTLFSEIALRKTNLDPPRFGDGERALNGLISLHDAYYAYEAALADSGSVDYEGMICQAVHLLRVDPWVGMHLRRQYRHTLVDEGQELTHGQYELLKEMCGEGNRNVFVVADVDQSINSFAGGRPTFLKEFAHDFEARRSHLTEHFRSAKAIVAVLQSLRNNFSKQIKQPLQLDLPKNAHLASGWVGARSYSTEHCEASAVSEWIVTLLEEGLDRSWTHEGESPEVAHEDICLLGRNRYSLDAGVTMLKNEGIPVVVSTERGALFESRLGRSGYYILQLTQNLGDLPARTRLLTEIEGMSLQAHSGENLTEMTPALRQWADGGNLPREFVEALIATSTARPNGLGTVSKLVEINSEWDEEGTGAWYRDQQLLDQLLRQYELRTSAPNRSLTGFLRMLSRMEQAPLTEPGVRALTPHRARGLGFKVVVVLGMNEGTLPDYRATTDNELNEERRVAYVAASRASRALLFTRPRRRVSRYGKPYLCQESRFIKEMGLTMEEIP